jgi:SAM-dependent MidA family methyltransferase
MSKRADEGRHPAPLKLKYWTLNTPCREAGGWTALPFGKTGEQSGDCESTLSVGRSLPLHAAAPELIEIIRNRIRQQGPVSFAWFMEQALYHAQFGYYASGRAEIGRLGDYFTNISVGPLFGRLLAAQFFEIWSKLGKTNNFVIVEQGAHHGEFAADVLASIRGSFPDFFSTLHYCVVEPFVVLRDRQAQRLAEFGDKIEWCHSVEALQPFVGIHFSNELLDALPVHLIVATRDGWEEKFVSVEGDRFVFVEQTIVDPALKTQVKKVEAASRRLWAETRQDAASTLPALEVNLSALDWIDNLSTKLTEGFALTIDYGFPRAEFYAADRTSGTLQIRSQHRSLDSPFAAIGRSDITAHVEWTSVAERAEACGLRLVGFTDQHHFLTGIISELADFFEKADPKAKRALQTLLHPEMLGRRFQVLALARNVDATIDLSGFKFARDARTALGL